MQSRLLPLFGKWCRNSFQCCFHSSQVVGNRCAHSGLGTRQVAVLPHQRYLLRAIKSYTASRMNAGRRIKTYSIGHRPDNLLAMRNTAVDRSYIFPSSHKIILPVCWLAPAVSGKSWCASSPCKEAKRNWPDLSRWRMNCTDAWQSVHTPSKKTMRLTGMVTCEVLFAGNLYFFRIGLAHVVKHLVHIIILFQSFN